MTDDSLPDGIGQAEYDALVGALTRKLHGSFTIQSVATALFAAGWRHPSFMPQPRGDRG